MKKTVVLLIVSLLMALACAGYFFYRFNVFEASEYRMEDFGIDRIKSTVDFNQNGMDDYEDFLIGARKDAENKPTYDGSYVVGGYPPDDKGVCTDVIWRAFKQAGYNLREMVDLDIHEHQADYGIAKIDNNIDFRRVGNLHVYFNRYAESLTNDIAEIEAFQPGDIVIFDNDRHIGMVSDKRNSEGKPYIIHNEGQTRREEDYLKRNKNITAHFRFDAGKIDSKYLVRWED